MIGHDDLGIRTWLWGQWSYVTAVDRRFGAHEPNRDRPVQVNLGWLAAPLVVNRPHRARSWCHAPCTSGTSPQRPRKPQSLPRRGNANGGGPSRCSHTSRGASRHRRAGGPHRCQLFQIRSDQGGYSGPSFEKVCCCCRTGSHRAHRRPAVQLQRLSFRRTSRVWSSACSVVPPVAIVARGDRVNGLGSSQPSAA
jgi:hypothetical protein